MITKTIGSGGDYPTILDAYIAIAPSSPSPALADSYTFYIISDFTEKNITNIQNTYRINLDGKSVSFVNNGSYRITVPNLVTYNFVSEGSILGGSISWQDMIYILPFDYGNGSSLFNFIGSAGVTYTIEYKNMIILGGGVNPGVDTNIFAISDQANVGWGAQAVKMYNCKIYGIGRAVVVGVSSDSVSSRTDIENCSIYGCNYGFNLQQRSSGTIRFYIKNCVSVTTTADFTMNPILNNPDKISISNCADSDNSISASGATISNCITGITSNDFESVTSTSPDFLKLPKGAINAVPTVNPDRGKNPLRVNFRSNAEYFFGARLAGTGTIPTLSTTDLQGNTYGQYGYYPIGCYNAEVA